MSTAVPTIHVVDDDASFRKSVSRLLLTCGYSVTAYETATELLENLPAEGPGCVLLDVRMPGLSGPELQARLTDRGSTLPVVFMTGHGDIPTSVQAIKAGAEDFLSKKTLLASIQRALLRYENERKKSDQLERLRLLVKTLTPREKQVFVLVVHGRLNKQIAHALGTSERTVKVHRHAVMEKLQVQSLAAAVTIAERLGMLSEA